MRLSVILITILITFTGCGTLSYPSVLQGKENKVVRDYYKSNRDAIVNNVLGDVGIRLWDNWFDSFSRILPPKLAVDSTRNKWTEMSLESRILDDEERIRRIIERDRDRAARSRNSRKNGGVPGVHF